MVWPSVPGNETDFSSFFSDLVILAITLQRARTTSTRASNICEEQYEATKSEVNHIIVLSRSPGSNPHLLGVSSVKVPGRLPCKPLQTCGVLQRLLGLVERQAQLALQEQNLPRQAGREVGRERQEAVCQL